MQIGAASLALFERVGAAVYSNEGTKLQLLRVELRKAKEDNQDMKNQVVDLRKQIIELLRTAEKKTGQQKMAKVPLDRNRDDEGIGESEMDNKEASMERMLMLHGAERRSTRIMPLSPRRMVLTRTLPSLDKKSRTQKRMKRG